MLKFPWKEEGKKEKETEGRGKEGNERKGGRGKKEEEKCKGTERVGILRKKKKGCKKEMKVLGLLPGRRIFFGALYGNRFHLICSHSVFDFNTPRDENFLCSHENFNTV